MGSGHWGACCPRGSPLSPSLCRMVRVWERWVTHSEKGDILSLHTWLASEWHSQGGAGQITVPLHPGLCAAGRGHQGMQEQGAKGGCVKRGDAMCGPSDLPSGKGPLFAHKWGWGSKGWCGALC